MNFVRMIKSFVLASLLLLSLNALAQTARDKAKMIHDRLVGLPPAPAVLNQMETLVEAGDSVSAANIAMANPAFYNVALKNWITPWTNENNDVHQPLNDFTATVIGMIRDDVPFSSVLSANLVYTGAAGLNNVPGYSQSNNNHYIALEENRFDLSDPSVLVAQAQSALPDAQILADKTGGVMTTRAAAKEFMSAGTNRLVFARAMETFMCKTMEDLNDVSASSDRIRQDVTRSPGGNSNIFLSTCIGCHTGMDPMAGAYAYLNYDEENERMVYTDAQVQEKYTINDTTFPGGYVTVDDNWKNYWRNGINSSLGWSANKSGSGNGPQSFGEEIGASEAFAACQVQKVFDKVCLRKPRPNEEQVIKDLTVNFRNSNYKMKTVFAEVAAHCAQ